MSMKTKKSASKAVPKMGAADKSSLGMAAKPAKKPARRGK